jgi:hypothetical protein
VSAWIPAPRDEQQVGKGFAEIKKMLIALVLYVKGTTSS